MKSGPCLEHCITGSRRRPSLAHACSLGLTLLQALGWSPALSERSGVAVSGPVYVFGRTSVYASLEHPPRMGGAGSRGDGCSSHGQPGSQMLFANGTPTSWCEIRLFPILASTWHHLPFALWPFSTPFVLWVGILRPRRWPLSRSREQRHLPRLELALLSCHPFYTLPEAPIRFPH